jgi:hypothetical protein
MTRIDKIPGIKSNEVKVLHSQNISSITDLWSKIGQEFDHGIDNLADDTGIKKSRLVELLKAQAVKEANRQGSWAGRHWLELAILALLLLVLALLLYASSTGVLAWVVAG